MGNVSAKLVSESAIEKLQRHERSDVDGLSMESPPDSPGHPVKNIVIVNGLGKHIPDSPSLTETLPTTENDSLISGLSDERTRVTSIVVRQWDGIKHYSDFILDGLRFRKEDASNVVMLFESPSSSDRATSFFNGQVYKFHDFPPEPTIYKSVLAPCRYSVVNGNTFPSYLRDPAPEGLMEHWRKFVPGFVEPTFVREINQEQTVYAYLPVEHLHRHVNDPHVHYHLAGKDALNLMTDKTTKLLTNTQDKRPCICKTTHSMASKGIFVIRSDSDEQEFNQFLAETGNPTFVITEYIEIARNVACHFFIHPTGEVTWFGSNENCATADGGWSPDSTILVDEQDALRELQMPFVEDVVRYCLSLGFWGFCGCDVLFDANGKGYLVDVNPRVTGSCPAIMIAQRLYTKHGFKYCLFRRNSKYAYRGTANELLREVEEYNERNYGQCCIVLNSFCEAENASADNPRTLVNIGVYSGRSLDDCQQVLDSFAPLNDRAARED